LQAGIAVDHRQYRRTQCRFTSDWTSSPGRLTFLASD
jgi:hypothetical protein